MKKSVWIKVGVFALLAGLMYVAAQFICGECLGLQQAGDMFSAGKAGLITIAEHVKEFIEQMGPWGIFIFIAVYAVNTVTVLPPIYILSWSAGALFGAFWGGTAVLIGAFLGTSATFFISRFFGAKFVEKHLKNEKAKAFMDKLGDNGFFVLLPMRLIGVPEYNLVNYLSGLTKIKYRDYVLATMIGFVPLTYAQAWVASEAATLNLKDPKLYAALLIFMAVVMGPTYLLKRKKQAALAAQETPNG